MICMVTYHMVTIESSSYIRALLFEYVASIGSYIAIQALL